MTMHWAIDPPRTARDGWRPMVVACGAEYESLQASGDREMVTCRDCIDMVESGQVEAARTAVAAWEEARVATLRSLRRRFILRITLYGLAIAALVLFLLWAVVWT